jgi:hypothetical protein
MDGREETTLMDKMHTLVGEDFFRGMMRLEDERKRRLAGGNQWGGAGGGNIISLLDNRRRQTERTITPFVPPKSSV